MTDLLSLVYPHLPEENVEGVGWPGDAESLASILRPSVLASPLGFPRNVCIEWQGPDGLWADSYSTAATVLLNWTLRVNGYQECLVYPILFLFRHYVELRLKEIAELAAAEADMPCERLVGHDLAKLWREAREALNAARDTDDSALRHIDRCIHELSELDPNAQAFRYGTDTRGNDIILKRPDASGEAVLYVNLSELAKVMGAMQTFLDGTYTMLWEAIQARGGTG